MCIRDRNKNKRKGFTLLTKRRNPSRFTRRTASGVLIAGPATCTVIAQLTTIIARVVASIGAFWKKVTLRQLRKSTHYKHKYLYVFTYLPKHSFTLLCLWIFLYSFVYSKNVFVFFARNLRRLTATEKNNATQSHLRIRCFSTHLLKGVPQIQLTSLSSVIVLQPQLLC